MYLAEFNIGILRYDWDDPRLKDFVDNLDRVNAIAHRSPGFIWQMGPEEMEAAQLGGEGLLAGNTRTASTLSVWKDVASLEHFVWKTLHKKFYDRRGEWYDEAAQGWNGRRLVLWWVPEGHQPTITEAAERLNHLANHGDSDFAFGWRFAQEAA